MTMIRQEKKPDFMTDSQPAGNNVQIPRAIFLKQTGLKFSWRKIVNS
jgi:hypothetical protein